MDGMRRRIADRLAGKGGKEPGDPKPGPKPRYAPFPGAGFFHTGQKSPLITAMGRRLVAEGCGRYEKGPSPEWTEADRESYAAWQRKLGYRGKDADGVPGRTSWDRLKVPSDD
jgi:hypothetical protein